MLVHQRVLKPTVDGCEILHHQKDGWNPNKIMGCLPSINWCGILQPSAVSNQAAYFGVYEMMRLDSETFKIVWGFQKLTLPSGNWWQFAVQMAHWKLLNLVRWFTYEKWWFPSLQTLLRC